MTPAQALLREVARDPGAIHLDLELRLAIDEELEGAAQPTTAGDVLAARVVALAERAERAEARVAELERTAPDWPTLVGPVTGQQVHRRFGLIRDTPPGGDQ